MGSDRPLRIGIDLDNTIACYEDVFRLLAEGRGLIDAARWKGRVALRDDLRRQGLEDVWTEIQGEAYGAEMESASSFPGALDFVTACRRRGDIVFIVSHRTRQPYRGEPVDLHAAARSWLEQQGFVGKNAIPAAQVFLEVTIADKVKRITELGCTHFIDDLPELLTDARFPVTTAPILFDPSGAHVSSPVLRLRCWAEAASALRGEGGSR